MKRLYLIPIVLFFISASVIAQSENLNAETKHKIAFVSSSAFYDEQVGIKSLVVNKSIQDEYKTDIENLYKEIKELDVMVDNLIC